MRILQVLTHYSSDGSYGGPASVAFAQTEQLVRDGHSVTLLVGSPKGNIAPKISGARVLTVRTRHFAPIGYASNFSPTMSIRVCHLSRHADVVHVHSGRDLAGFTSALFSTVPAVLQTHGMIAEEKGLIKRLFDRLYTLPILRKYRMILTLSEREATCLPPLQKAVAVRQLHNGGPTPSLKASFSEPPTVIYLSRMAERKHPERYLSIADLGKTEKPSWEFQMYGPLEEATRPLKKALLESSAVEYLGAASRDAVPGILARSHVMILPSEREVYPMSVIESLLSGVPVVTTSSNDLATSLGESPGLQVSDGTVSDLWSRTKNLLSSRESWERGHKDALALADQHFRIESVTARLNSYYDEICSPPRQSG